MKYKIPAIFCLCVILSALAIIALEFSGCSSKIDPYDESFTIQFPENWKIERHIEEAVITGFSPIEGPMDTYLENVFVFVEIMPINVSVQKYYDIGIGLLYEEAKNVDVREQGMTTLDGREAKWIICTFEMDNHKFKMLVYMVIKRRKAYVIACGALPETFDRYKPEFERIVSTFKIK